MDVLNWHEALMPYEQAVAELIVKFDGISDEYRKLNQHSPIESVQGRVKNVGSILSKASRKNIPLDRVFDKMEDIAGMRIITRFVADIQTIVEQLKKRSEHDLKIIEERDYINNRKLSGYQSYHLLCKYTVMCLNGTKEIWVEVQIRTLAMNFWAIIEHSLQYKYNGNIPPDIQSRLFQSAEAAYRLDKEMAAMHSEISDVQRIMQVKNDMVDTIVKKLRNLYFIAKIDTVNELHREFIDIYQDYDVDKLAEFNNKLSTIARIYKVEHI